MTFHQARVVELFLESSQEARADLLTRWTEQWAREGAPFSSCLSALLEASRTSPVRIQQIDTTLSTTLVSLMIEGAGTSASIGAAVAAAQFLAIHDTSSVLQDLLCNELRSQADTARVHCAIGLLTRQQTLQADPIARHGKPRRIAMRLLEARIADYHELPTGASAQLQQRIFDDIEQLKGQLPMSPYFGPCTIAFGHQLLSGPQFFDEPPLPPLPLTRAET